MAEGEAITETVDRQGRLNSSLDTFWAMHSDWYAMPVQSNLQATLSDGALTVLHRARFMTKAHLIVTGIAGEFATIPFQTKTNGFVTRSFEGTEARLKVIETMPSATISAKAPAGVGSLDITYDLRTGTDA
jgi:hypothetical protein